MPDCPPKALTERPVRKALIAGRWGTWWRTGDRLYWIRDDMPPDTSR